MTKALSTIAAFFGLVLIGILLLIRWAFQLCLLLTGAFHQFFQLTINGAGALIASIQSVNHEQLTKANK